MSAVDPHISGTENLAEGARAAAHLPRARIGLIIPSSNRMTEPQFHRFCPADIGVHITRLQMTGKWHKHLGELHDVIKGAASALADSRVDLIVFHCTGHSMQEGLEGDRKVIELIQQATGSAAISTAQAITEALGALEMRKIVIISPYRQQVNDDEIRYLTAAGFEVLHDHGLGLKGGDEYITVTPERWHDIVMENARDDADGYFLSCTNTTMIEAIPALERDLQKPVINSNQAVIWAFLKRIGEVPNIPEMGRLFAI